MKASELIDTCIVNGNDHVVVELPNGDRVSTQRYYFDTNKRDEGIIVIKCGRKLEK